MQGHFGRRSKTWLAFGPAALSLILTTGAMAQDRGQVSAVHRQVSAAEARVAKAISAKDSNSLSRIGNDRHRWRVVVGDIVRVAEPAIARRH